MIKIVLGEDGTKPVAVLDEQGNDLARSLQIVSIYVELPGANEMTRATLVLEGVQVEATLVDGKVTVVGNKAGL
jgi:hypothetical protein